MKTRGCEDGRVSRAVNWEYIDWYNKAWDRALAPLRELFRVPTDDEEPVDWNVKFMQEYCARLWQDLGGGRYDEGAARCDRPGG